MQDLINAVSEQCKDSHQKSDWTGSFSDYLKIVFDDPNVARNAFQRAYDMIVSYGTEEVVEHKKKMTRFKFRSEERYGGKDAIFGIDQSLGYLVDVFKSASKGYGTERRVILLHGPVGSAKSTIVRLLKKGIENYSRTKEGRVFTFVRE